MLDFKVKSMHNVISYVWCWTEMVSIKMHDVISYAWC